jgi:hypothetical protein
MIGLRGEGKFDDYGATPINVFVDEFTATPFN